MVKVKYKRGRVAYYFQFGFKRFLELGGTFKFNNRSWNFFRASIGTMSWEFHIVFDLRCFGPQHPKGGHFKATEMLFLSKLHKSK